MLAAVRGYRRRKEPQSDTLTRARRAMEVRVQASRGGILRKRDQTALLDHQRTMVSRVNKHGRLHYNGSAYDVDITNTIEYMLLTSNESNAAIARKNMVAATTVGTIWQRMLNGEPTSKVTAARESSGLTRRKLDIDGARWEGQGGFFLFFKNNCSFPTIVSPLSTLAELITVDPRAYLDELVARLAAADNIDLAATTIANYLKYMGLARKKYNKRHVRALRGSGVLVTNGVACSLY